MNVAAGKAHFEYGWIGIFRITDGKIAEAWIQEDNLWIMQQLGLELKPAETDSQAPVAGKKQGND